MTTESPPKLQPRLRESVSVPDAIGITVYFLITGELLAATAGQRAPLSFLAT